MNGSVVLLTLFSWPAIVLAIFSLVSARRAVIVTFLLAWLFLPIIGFKIAPGFPIYDKMNATCFSVMLAVIVFDSRRFSTLNLTWPDVFMAIWCLCPLASSVENALGVYDGASAVFAQTMTWGAPYLIGRLYFPDLAALRQLAIALFIGGLVYVPLCLIEMRFSPQLHNWVYGFQQHSFVQSIRWGGYRPTVFMDHGIMVAMWMCSSALIGLWLWRAGALRLLLRVPMPALVAAVLVTAILCKSTGAIILLGLGAVALFAGPYFRTRLLVWLLIAVAPLYMIVRGAGLWDGSELVSTASTSINADRGDSLKTRIDNENMLAKKARNQPIFGWGGWGRNRVFDSAGKDITITDGFWIIAFGSNGLVGLVSWTLAMLLPLASLFRRYRPQSWSDPAIAPAMALGVVVLLYVLDCIPDSMTNPIFMLCLGGIATLTSHYVAASTQPSPANLVRARRRAPELQSQPT